MDIHIEKNDTEIETLHYYTFQMGSQIKKNDTEIETLHYCTLQMGSQIE